MEPTPESVKTMKRKATPPNEMRPEYNFDYSKAVRGKYYKRILKESANIAVLEPDIAKAFPNSVAVNDALRVVLQAGLAARRITTRSTRTRAKVTRAG